jgi:hypothetical protein
MSARHACKWLLYSRTFNVNVIAAVLLALEMQFGLLAPYLPERWHAFAALGLALVNAYLRVVTTQPVSLHREDVHYERGR